MGPARCSSVVSLSSRLSGHLIWPRQQLTRGSNRLSAGTDNVSTTCCHPRDEHILQYSKSVSSICKYMSSKAKVSSESTTPYSWQMANKYDYLSLVLQTSNTLFWTSMYFVLFIWKPLNLQMLWLLYCIRSFSCRDSSSRLPSRRTYKPPMERYWGSSSFCDQLYFFRRHASL